MNDIRVGSVLGGRYAVDAVLGKGGMGTVYGAHDKQLERPVAIKVLHDADAMDDVAVKRFRREALALGALGHPHLCTVYDVGALADGVPFLVMERLDGMSLGARLKQLPPLSSALLAHLIAQAGDALSTAHEAGVLHRDIKPDNIYLSRAPGSTWTAKLLDFGVAKFSRNGLLGDADASLTKTGMVMGTPYYMSPEQARGQRDIDARVDIYALGVVAYECFAGKRPFAGTPLNLVLVKILSEKPESLARLRPDLDATVISVIEKAMSKNRDYRYASAREFGRELLRAERTARHSESKIKL